MSSFPVLFEEKKTDIQKTPLVLTATTTGAATLTLFDVTVAAGKSIVVDWGDGSTSTYGAGSGTRTHAYASAGVWTVKLSNRGDITGLNLQDAKITATISKTNPMPSGLTSLSLALMASFNWATSADVPFPSGLTLLNIAVTGVTGVISATNPIPSGITNLLIAGAGFTWTVSTTAPMPSGLTTLNLSTNNVTWAVTSTNPMPASLTNIRLTNCANITWTVSTTAPMPAGLTTIYFLNVPGLVWNCDVNNPLPAGLVSLTLWEMYSITIPAARWAVNTLQTVRFEGALSQAAVDDILLGMWTNKANYTAVNPTLDLLGTNNRAPGGVYQAASPPTTGKEYAYDLATGAYRPAGPEWTVSIPQAFFGLLGDSITASNGWPPLVYAAYKSGASYGLNHAVAGKGIMDNMDAQTVAAAGDAANIIIIELGTNDNNAGDMVALQAEFEENVAELKVSNPLATIYVMNVLPRWTDSGGGTVVDKSNIRTAIAAAALAQAVTCWDTSGWWLASDTTDGTHPNASGNTKIKNEVLARLPA